MRLLDSSMTQCVFVDQKNIDDGEGGTTTEWIEGAKFQAAIMLDRSLQAQIAMAKGVKGIYTVITNRNTRLDYHKVFKRKSDGKIFRVISKDDSAPPESASLNARSVNAEEWSLA